ncbi:translation initiation factor 3 subunit J [Sporothrix brasiliensis 5110]|uniref:Eukaryotic translation initiation factor 3 subunit J n=1 Tax=Sporothrix brasiliensis 5110 TaxID=1398154 RepID=A0A0C2J3W8_9PEZI|nr:translation initiation factor 3 subunit J [Sporothrix brasiliensis 5110]KIH93680.1 translation initiation factor 3 subunit J [Sporothrix brasiliensis 5110]
MPGKWDDEEESSSSGSEAGSAVAPPPHLLRRANKFEDEEEEDSDVLDSWDADDSEAEREKAKKEAEAQAKAKAAAAAAAANKKSKNQRIAEHITERARAQAQADADSALREGETEAERRERMRRSEQEADLQHAADLFGDAGLSAGTGGGARKSAAALKASAISIDASDPSKTVDLGSLPLLNPVTKLQFDKLQQTLGPIISAHAHKGPYVVFAQNLIRELCRGLPSDQIKKINSSLTALANDRLREEKASEKGGKKTKAAKTKTTLAIARPNTVDTGSYDDDAYGE